MNFVEVTIADDAGNSAVMRVPVERVMHALASMAAIAPDSMCWKCEPVDSLELRSASRSAPGATVEQQGETATEAVAVSPVLHNPSDAEIAQRIGEQAQRLGDKS